MWKIHKAESIHFSWVCVVHFSSFVHHILVSRSFQPTEPKKFDTNIRRTERKKKLDTTFESRLWIFSSPFTATLYSTFFSQQSIGCMWKCGFVIEFLFFFSTLGEHHKFFSSEIVWRKWMEFFFLLSLYVDKANTKWKWHVWWNVIYLS